MLKVHFFQGRFQILAGGNDFLTFSALPGNIDNGAQFRGLPQNKNLSVYVLDQ